MNLDPFLSTAAVWKAGSRIPARISSLGFTPIGASGLGRLFTWNRRVLRTVPSRLVNLPESRWVSS